MTTSWDAAEEAESYYVYRYSSGKKTGYEYDNISLEQFNSENYGLKKAGGRDIMN